MQNQPDAFVRARRFSETLPDVVPHSSTLHEALSSGFPILILRIDPERRTADQAERVPSRLIQTRSELLGGTQPSQEITDGIGNG
jgi:hypothetical protein